MQLIPISVSPYNGLVCDAVYVIILLPNCITFSRFSHDNSLNDHNTIVGDVLIKQYHNNPTWLRIEYRFQTTVLSEQGGNK